MDIVEAQKDDNFHLLKYVDDEFYVILYPNGKWYLIDEIYSNNSLSSVLQNQTLQPEPSRTESKKVVNICVFITDRCNLMCDYCKVDNFLSQKRKSINLPKIIHAIKKIAMDTDKIQVLFYGGEPLLNYGSIRKICEALTDVEVEYSVTTNGTILSNEILYLIQEYDISVGVSIDGEKLTHDANRVFKSKKGSFDIVTDNYSKLQQNLVSVGPMAVAFDPSTYYSNALFFHNEMNNSVISIKNLEFTGNEKIDEIKLYYNILFKQQKKLIEYYLDMFEKNGTKLSNTNITSLISNVILSNDDSIKSCKSKKSPDCTLGDEMFGIDINGDVMGCPDLIEFNNKSDRFISLIKTKNNYCAGCKFQKVCPSLCLSIYSEEYLDKYFKMDYSDPIDALCNYNQKMIHYVFKLISTQPNRLLNYFFG